MGPSKIKFLKKITKLHDREPIFENFESICETNPSF